MAVDIKEMREKSEIKQYNKFKKDNGDQCVSWMW